jgi:hypothetical protein
VSEVRLTVKKVRMTARERRHSALPGGVAMAAWSTMLLKRNLLNVLLTKAPVTETVL